MARFIVLSLVVALSPALLAADRVRLLDGAAVSGKIIATSRESLRIETIDGETEVAVAEVAGVYLDDEPPQVTQARVHFTNAGYQTAIDKLALAGDFDAAKKPLRQEAGYLRAASMGRLAAAGKGDVQAAGEALAAYLREEADSPRYYDAAVALGELQTALGRHEQAERTYSQLAKSPSRPLKARAALYVGLSRQARGDHAAALKRFDALLAMRPEGAAEASAQARARGAKAVSLAATGKLDAALDMARESVTQADADDYAALATGYNTLGRCYEAADRDRDALYAYLHTDYLFNTDPSTHAEALSRLTELWRAAGKPDAAKEARTRLERRYAATPWARAAAGQQAN